jgi:hypothetical protein
MAEDHQRNEGAQNGIAIRPDYSAHRAEKPLQGFT